MSHHRKDSGDNYDGLPPWKAFLLRFFKGVGIIVGTLAVAVVLIFGLALGACFLGK